MFWALVFSAGLCTLAIFALTLGLVIGALPGKDRLGLLGALALCGILDVYLGFVTVKIYRARRGADFD